MNKGKQNILVAGANGTTGKIIVDLLKHSDKYTPVAMVREQGQKEQFEKDNVTVVLADLEQDLSQAVNNVHKVIFAAGSKGKNVEGIDRDGAKRLTDAAKEAGATKFVMLSSMGADNPSANEDLRAYLQAKQAADEHLMASGMNYSIIRPGSLSNEKGTGKIELQEKFERQGDITRADVAQTLVAVLEDGVQQNQICEILSGKIPIEVAVRA
ncbi:SDR family oxidoreductase [Dyadobacter tibetensis]|uniref:SDR family oxidoreductase n=1 Tax=Dyadobacter tibetensis TaxID=1211851 RepID=UPI0004727FA7|nr:SDR family oxidoreductase [Dyadobacter tibetensis]